MPYQYLKYQQQANDKNNWSNDQKKNFLFSIGENSEIKDLKKQQPKLRTTMNTYLLAGNCNKLEDTYLEIIQHSYKYWELSKSLLENTLKTEPPKSIEVLLKDPHDHT